MSFPNLNEHPLILFDGVCVLCNRSVRFILTRDKQKRFRFAPLQSSVVQRLFRQRDLPLTLLDTSEGDELTSVILIEGKNYYQESTAALRILKHLGFPWSLLYIFHIVPRFIRDGIYRWIACHRYRWFGKYDQCMIPDKEVREQFLDF